MHVFQAPCKRLLFYGHIWIIATEVLYFCLIVLKSCTSLLLLLCSCVCFYQSELFI